MSRSLNARARHAIGALGLGTVTMIVAGTSSAWAHGTDNVVMGSTTNGGGSLVAGYNYLVPILVTPSTTIAGFTIHTASNPGLTPLLVDDAPNNFFVLNDGTTLSFTLAAPLDAGVSVKIGTTVLHAVGETAPVGTFQAANPDLFHVHPTWTLTVASGTLTTRQVSFKLSAPGYGNSPVYTVLLSNILPTPTATPTVTTTATLTPTPTVTATATLTVTPTPTVTAAATLTATPDLTPTATGTVSPVASATATVPVATPSPLPSALPHLGDAAAAKAAAKCATAIQGVGGRHARATLASLGKCVHAGLRCIELEAADPACLTKAGEACAKTLAKLADGESKLTSTIEKKCAPLGVADVLAAAGLGWLDGTVECAGFGTTLVDLASVGQCLARQHTCQAEVLLGAETPRAGEALRLAGQSLGSNSCLPDYGGTGGSVGDPKGVGKSLIKCNLAAAATGGKLVQTRLARGSKCLAAVFACVQTRSGDAVCLAGAQATCQGGSAAVVAAEDKLGVALAKACGPVPFATLAANDAARLAALASDCAALGVPALASVEDHRECVRRQHACRAGDLLGLELPRAAELLDLVGDTLHDAFCPVAP